MRAIDFVNIFLSTIQVENSTGRAYPNARQDGA